MKKFDDNIRDTVKDFKFFLDHIEKLARPLSKEQRRHLNTVLMVQLQMLVALKNASNLGKVTFSAIEDLFFKKKKK